ncbi:hypothetical protein GMO_24400 [Gluconobacter morbifer G707]|uniref:Uncharacterized protein n=1 Tax=Gluconobacter morbifer G707 TaxID=1088869 RepID=G6XL17_9PROT|nr:hypothetical protein GMO_24400 [Gluconobacter morbifer G707]
MLFGRFFFSENRELFCFSDRGNFGAVFLFLTFSLVVWKKPIGAWKSYILISGILTELS